MANTSEELGEKIHFAAGETIYSQEDESKGVYLLLGGKVDIWHYEQNEASHIATIGEGELLGEVSVIEKRPHSVTAKASQPTSALFINSKSFHRSFSDPLVRHVVSTLAARLRSSYAVSKKEITQPVTFKSSHPVLEGGSRLVVNKLLTFVELTEFPFMVGNISSRSKHSLVKPASLRIPLNSAPELAENHFEVVRRDGLLHIRDLGSPQGTLVNGDHLSKYTMKATAKLHVGENEVIAGKDDSPVRFILTIPPTEYEV